jgi:phosphonopyruvate decarboxylase
MDSFEALKVISQHRTDEIVIAVMSANYEWPHVSTNSDLDMLEVGTMSMASSVGLGLALALPDRRVIVLDGDGSLLMNLGSLATIANMAPPNLIHFVLENGVYRMTGGQPTPNSGKVSFTGFAKAAGYPNAYEFCTLESLKSGIAAVLTETGPTLVSLKLEPRNERPSYQLNLMSKTLPRFKEGLRRVLAQQKKNRMIRN